MTRIIGIHGFLFKPGTRHDPAPLYDAWENALGMDIEGFGWNARPSWGFLGIGGDVGRWNASVSPNRQVNNPYQLAQIWALREGMKLNVDGAVVLAHSLGARVALEACRHGKPKAVLLFHGSEYTAIAARVARMLPGVPFFASTSDRDFPLWEGGYRYGRGLDLAAPFRRWNQHDVIFEEPVIGRDKHRVLSDNWVNFNLGGGHWEFNRHWRLWRQIINRYL